MNDTNELVTAAKTKLGVRNDSEFARRIGVSRQAVSHWKSGTNCMDERTAAELARIVGVDPRDAVIMVQAERAKNEKDRKFWRDLLSTTATLTIMPVVYAVATVGFCILCQISKALRRAAQAPSICSAALHIRASTA